MQAEHTVLTIHSMSRENILNKRLSIRLHYFSLHRPDVIREDDVSRLFMYERGAERVGPNVEDTNRIILMTQRCEGS